MRPKGFFRWKDRVTPLPLGIPIRVHTARGGWKGRLRARWPWAAAAGVLAVAVLVGAGFGIRALARRVSGPADNGGLPSISQQNQDDRVAALLQPPQLQYQSVAYRDLSSEVKDVQFSQAQINQPGVYGHEIFFSCGTGSLDGPVLTRMCTYNLDTGEETQVAETKIYNGEYYETLISDKYLVYLETDHGTNNNIYVLNRGEEKPTLIKTCKNGKPKLRLSGDTLIWMEQVDENLDNLQMIDMVTQENVTLFEISDVATYGVSAPCIHGDTIVWAGPDTAQSEEDKANGEKSAIYTLNLDTDIDDGGLHPQSFTPGTYVHEPQFDGVHYVWIDSNKSFDSNLYLSVANGTPQVIASGVTTYGLGDGIVVYGKDQGVWVYVMQTGETCRLTSDTEKGIMPQVQGRTVVWHSTSSDGKDVLRFKILSDEDLRLSAQEEA